MENHTQNAVETLFPDPFLKNQNWAYICINSRNTLKLNCGKLAFTFCKAFLKNKMRSGTSLPPSFSVWFLKKNICLEYWPDQISLSGCLYFVRYCALCVMYLLINLAVKSWILKSILSFKSSRFFYIPKKSPQKFKYLENEESF